MINKVILIGRLGKDPEVRYTQDGMQITNFSMATSEYGKSKSGERVERTEWHSVATFGKTAEFCGNYLGKGRLVFCEGRLQTRSWDDKEGKKHYKTEVVATTIRLLESKQNRETDSKVLDEGPDFSIESDPHIDDVPF